MVCPFWYKFFTDLARPQLFSRTNELLLKYLDLIDGHKRDIENSKANLRYFEVLRDNLKKS